MFPDLLRDDVFRLETRRLWLRWPRAGDAPAIAALAGARDVAEMTAHVPHPYPPGAAEEWVLASRTANLGGKALNLVLTPMARPNEVLGAIGLWEVAPDVAEIGYWLGKPFWNQGLMSEAARALTRLSLRVSAVDAIRSSALPVNVASRRVLEKCGFVRRGEEMRLAPARGGAILVDVFELARHAVAERDGAALKKCA